MPAMIHALHGMLCELGVCSEDSLEPLFPRLRDREDIGVLRCSRSGVILLTRIDHMDLAHYETKPNFRGGASRGRQHAVLQSLEDDTRREGAFRSAVVNRRWLDVGTGTGSLLRLLGPVAATVAAVEPQAIPREELRREGYTAFQSVGEVPDSSADVITLSHVLEHLVDPLETLQSLHRILAPGGRLLVEVPHARDFLLSFFKLEPFLEFTFWSEHLVLHTRESLRLLLEAGGFENVAVTAVQRFPLANHLHWLARGTRGGHREWAFLRSLALDTAYADMLATLDMTDTLVAWAARPR